MAEREFLGGWGTTLDGEHVPISKEEAAAIWEACEAADQKRREAMPDSLSALEALQDALTRLKDEGWREGQYCPKKGEEFAVMEFGSTGIFSGFYSGEWPSGHVHIGGCITDPKGILWKPIGALTADERARMEKCIDAERRMMGRQLRSFASE